MQAAYKKNTRALTNNGKHFALFKLVHGSAPDIAGKQIANPYPMIEPARTIEEAFINSLKSNIITADLGGNAKAIDVGKAIALRIMET